MKTVKLSPSWGTAFLFILISFNVHAQQKRFIVLGSDLPGLRGAVNAQGGNVDHDLVYHSGFVAHMSGTAVQRLAENFGSSVFIEEDHEVEASGKPVAAPPAQSVPWGVAAVQADLANAVTEGAGTVVCIVDTGIQSDHPDLSTNVLGGENFVMQKGSINASAWTDDNGHGTHVAGTVAALDNAVGVIGVAPQAGLFAVKVLDRRGSGYMSDVADGILSCVANGADVINMSLGSSADSAVVHDAVITASAAGVILVAAAGNEASGVSYPAKYDEVIAVSAVDSNMALAYFSNTGVEVDFAAPGVSVYSTTKGGSYATYSGTSMASPHVAGVAALMVASGRTQLFATDIGLTLEEQGGGFIDALLTVQ